MSVFLKRLDGQYDGLYERILPWTCYCVVIFVGLYGAAGRGIFDIAAQAFNFS